MNDNWNLLNSILLFNNSFSVLEDETIAIIQKLLQHGANINAVDNLGNTPLHMAIQANKGLLT